MFRRDLLKRAGAAAVVAILRPALPALEWVEKAHIPVVSSVAARGVQLATYDSILKDVYREAIMGQLMSETLLLRDLNKMAGKTVKFRKL